MLESIEVRVKEYTKSRDEMICSRHKITSDFLEKWIQANMSDPVVKKVLKNIEDLHQQVLVKQHIDEMIFEIPEQLTREVYLQIARKVQACVRHEAYKQVQKQIKESAKNELTDEEMDKILGDIGLEPQEHFRKSALSLFGIPLPEGETAKNLLQKAYLRYSTQRELKSAKAGETGLKSHWQQQIQKEQKVHSEII